MYINITTTTTTLLLRNPHHHNNMSLASVSDILCHVDSFWSDSTLDVLRMLMSTSKGIRSVLVVCEEEDGGVKKNKKNLSRKSPLRLPTLPIIILSPIERAILAMMQTRPLVMKISHAKYRFSLQVNAMVRHCAALPVGNSCRIDEVCSGRFTIQAYVTQLNRGNMHGRIHFIDAYRLASFSSSNGKMKAAMERRHLFDVDVLASVVSLVRMVGDRYERMDENVTNAIFKLYDGLEEAQKKKDVAATGKKKKVVGENALMNSIHQLEGLSNDLDSATFHMKDCFGVDRVATIPIPKTKANVHDYSALFPTLVNRYRLHSAKCPELMTMDCLVGVMPIAL